VAATLYGIGARLDEDPALFFELRQVKMSDLIGEAMQETADQLLQKSNRPSGQAIGDADLEEVFGIVMEDLIDFDPAAPPGAGKAFGASPKPGLKTTARSRGRKPRNSEQPGDDKRRILELIGHSRGGIDVPTLSRKTGVALSKIRQIVFAAYRKGQVEKLARGIYRGLAKRRSPGEEVHAVLTCINQSPGGIGVPEIEHLTAVSVARVRYIVARAHRDGKLRRVARGLYAPILEGTPGLTLTEVVLRVIRQSKEGATVAMLKEKTGLEDKQIQNIVFRLNRLGRIRRAGRGVYHFL
jgi:predicted transcriptional regulator of viral defense system